MANGDIGEPENSTGKVCFTGERKMTVVGDIVSNLQITTSNGSWCSEANVRFGNTSGGAGGWQFDQLFSPDNTGPCGTVNNPLDDYISSGTPVFKTDSTGCIHYQVFDHLNDSINKQDFKFDSGSISFYGCPVGQVLIPSIQIAQIPDTVCTNDSFIVVATAPLAENVFWYLDQIAGSPVGSGIGPLQLIIATSGVHKIYAIASNSNGSDTTSFTIQVIVPAKSAFNVSTQNLTASFKNLSTSGVNYLWKFGDGNTSTDFEPTHTYNVQGTYSVTLAVTNKCGSIISDTTKITLITSSSSNPSWVEKASYTLILSTIYYFFTWLLICRLELCQLKYGVLMAN
ncbi:MAG: PKD domain-containing protein [Saprospiraceae bacterium]|nr:PKD domain-containing protein [Saprospiraceae bacterium]